MSLDVRGRRCVIVGGGFEATDKATRLATAGAKVQVIANEVEPALEEMAERGVVSWAARGLERSDLDHAFVVIVTPDERDEAEAIARRAAAGEFLLCVIDVPDLCNFAHPAVFDVGEIKVALSSGGRAPAVLRRLREELQNALDTPRLRSFVSAMVQLRERTPSGERSARLREAVRGLTLRIEVELPEAFREITEPSTETSPPAVAGTSRESEGDVHIEGGRDVEADEPHDTRSTPASRRGS